MRTSSATTCIGKRCPPLLRSSALRPQAAPCPQRPAFATIPERSRQRFALLTERRARVTPEPDEPTLQDPDAPPYLAVSGRRAFYESERQGRTSPALTAQVFRP